MLPSRCLITDTNNDGRTDSVHVNGGGKSLSNFCCVPHLNHNLSQIPFDLALEQGPVRAPSRGPPRQYLTSGFSYALFFIHQSALDVLVRACLGVAMVHLVNVCLKRHYLAKDKTWPS